MKTKESILACPAQKSDCEPKFRGNQILSRDVLIFQPPSRISPLITLPMRIDAVRPSFELYWLSLLETWWSVELVGRLNGSRPEDSLLL